MDLGRAGAGPMAGGGFWNVRSKNEGPDGCQTGFRRESEAGRTRSNLGSTADAATFNRTIPQARKSPREKVILLKDLEAGFTSGFPAPFSGAGLARRQASSVGRRRFRLAAKARRGSGNFAQGSPPFEANTRFSPVWISLHGLVAQWPRSRTAQDESRAAPSQTVSK